MALVAAAALLRLSQFPRMEDHDEGLHALISLRFLTGDLNPRFFGGPAGPMFYGAALVYYLAYLVTAPFTGWSRLEFVEYCRAHLVVPIALGRGLSVVAVVATLCLLFALARRLCGIRTAFVAASFLAVCPPAVGLSAYFHKEILATFFLVLVAHQCAGLPVPSGVADWRKLGIGLGLLIGQKVTYVVAAVMPAGAYLSQFRGRSAAALPAKRRLLGLAIIAVFGLGLLALSCCLVPLPARGSTKYLGVWELEEIYQGREYVQHRLWLMGLLGVGCSLAGCWWRRLGDWMATAVLDARIAALAGTTAFTFVAVNPFLLLTPLEAQAMIFTEAGPSEGPGLLASFLRIVSFLTQDTLRTGVELLGLAAVPWCLWRGCAVQRLLVAYGVTFLAFMASNPLVRPWWVYSLLPFLYLWAAQALVGLASRLRLSPGRTGVVVTLVTALLVGPAAVRDVQEAHRCWLTDTRNLATKWALAHIPRGSAVAWTWYSILPPPGTYVLHDLAGNDLDPYLRRGCRWAAVCVNGTGRQLPADAPGVLRSLERFPVAWESWADGSIRTGPTIRIYQLDGARDLYSTRDAPSADSAGTPRSPGR